uniref:Uncharacterized protein n=1 Tax=Oryza barthii TaxID=65489 RepID=A0A0D3HFW8_9ORYZ
MSHPLLLLVYVIARRSAPSPPLSSRWPLASLLFSIGLVGRRAPRFPRPFASPVPGAALARRSRRSACSSHMPPRYRSPSAANTEMKRREKRKLKKIADPITRVQVRNVRRFIQPPISPNIFR